MCGQPRVSGEVAFAQSQQLFATDDEDTPSSLSGARAPDGAQPLQLSDRYVLASVVPPIKADLQLTDGEIGWLTSAFMIGYFATSPVFGYLGDSRPRKGLIVFGVTFWSLGTILSGFAHDYWTLLACRVLVGLGEASYAVLAPTWIADLFTAERRNNALTIFYSATPLGSALGYLLGGFALAHGGWRYGFFWAGAPGLLLALGLFLLAEPAHRKPGEGDLPSGGFSRSDLSGFAKLFRLRGFQPRACGPDGLLHLRVGAFAGLGSGLPHTACTRSYLRLRRPFLRAARLSSRVCSAR